MFKKQSHKQTNTDKLINSNNNNSNTNKLKNERIKK